MCIYSTILSECSRMKCFLSSSRLSALNSHSVQLWISFSFLAGVALLDVSLLTSFRFRPRVSCFLNVWLLDINEDEGGGDDDVVAGLVSILWIISSIIFVTISSFILFFLSISFMIFFFFFTRSLWVIYMLISNVRYYMHLVSCFFLLLISHTNLLF